jgi:small-conductance mechanosensitive channel
VRFQPVDPTLPALVLQARDDKLHPEFTYAAIALGVAAVALILVLGGFVYLVMQGRQTEARILLGAGVLGLVASFVRAGLRK